MSHSPSSSPASQVTSAERFWLIGAILFGSLLRLSFPERMAIEHFDEGVYASNLWFGPENDYSYPARYLYAPGLLPATIEWTLIFASICGISPTGFVPLLPCLVAGIAMIPSLWWVVRRWFGAGAGLLAAWFVATSDMHACYSRAALTDVPLGLFTLWGVYFLGQALLQVNSRQASGVTSGVTFRASKRGANQKSFTLKTLNQNGSDGFPWRNMLLAGCFTGLGWWTKYNGWLPLAIGLTGGLLWQCLLPRSERQVRRMLVCWSGIAAIAFLFWSPVLWGLQPHGGYTRVAANHRQYVVGLAGWGDSAWRQLQAIGFYENPWDWIPGMSGEPGNLGAPQGPVVFSSEDSVTDDGHGASRFVMRVRWLLVRRLPLVMPLAGLVIAALFLVRLLRHNRSSDGAFFCCLVASWLAGMTLATPFYHPYPRLVFPWLCAVWIGCSLAIDRCLIQSERLKLAESSRWPRVPLGLFVVTLVTISLLRVITGSAHCWRDRGEIQRAASQFAATARREAVKSGFPENEAIVYVIGEPALVFGMKAAGLPAVGPVQGLGFLNSPVLRPTLIAFPSRPSAMSPADREVLESDRFVAVDKRMVTSSHLVQKDDRQQSIKPDSHELCLYRLVR
jgi:4-amino-4-deoxy-L-arabinose transferase-like glycosyltransferase